MRMVKNKGKIRNYITQILSSIIVFEIATTLYTAYFSIKSFGVNRVVLSYISFMFILLIYNIANKLNAKKDEKS